MGQKYRYLIDTQSRKELALYPLPFFRDLKPVFVRGDNKLPDGTGKQSSDVQAKDPEFSCSFEEWRLIKHFFIRRAILSKELENLIGFLSKASRTRKLACRNLSMASRSMMALRLSPRGLLSLSRFPCLLKSPHHDDITRRNMLRSDS